MKKNLIIIVLIISLIAIGAGVYFVVFANSGDDTGREKMVYFTPGDYFVTNLNNSDSLVKVTVVLLLSEEGHEDALGSEQALIRNHITFILRSLSPEDFKKTDLEQILSDQICKKLNEEFMVEYFKQAIFSDLLVQ